MGHYSNRHNKKFSKIVAVILSVTLLGAALCSTLSASAAGNLAFSVGCQYSDINTSRDALKACDYYALCGFSSRYSTKPTLSTLRGSYNGTKFMESDIIFLAGHGNSGGIQFIANDTKKDLWVTTNTAASSDHIVLQRSYNMSRVKLIVFAGCDTAKETNNCAQVVVNNGCKAAIGWTVLVGDESMYNWENKFNNYLATGNSISNALKIANSFNYGDNSCKNWKLYGDGSQVLKHSRSTANNNIIDPNMKIVNWDFSADNLSDKTEISNILNTFYPTFNFEDFKIDLAMQDDGSGVITVVEKIGDYYTDNAYVLFYDGEKITEAFDRVEHKIDRASRNAQFFSLPLLDMNKVYAAARENIDGEYTIENQEAEAKYDSATGERYLLVGTTVSINGAKSVLSYKYVIE